MSRISMRLTARQWSTADATMDNAGSMMISNYADPEPAASIREAGWDQIPWVGAMKEWPPMTQVIAISLRLDQWKLIIKHLEADDLIYEELEDFESLRLGRDALQAILSQMP